METVETMYEVEYQLQIDDYKVEWLTMATLDQIVAVVIPERDAAIERFAAEWPGRNVRLVMVEKQHTVLAERAAS